MPLRSHAQRALRFAHRFRRELQPRPRGRILAVKWGLNPNSSSLGVDVTFLLFGATALSLATPVISALIRMRRIGSSPTASAESTSELARSTEPDSLQQ